MGSKIVDSSVGMYCIDSLYDCYLSNYHEPVLDTGEFFQDHQHGQGKLRSPSYTYEGAWAMNRMHGRGTFSSGDGSTYTGHFLKGFALQCLLCVQPARAYGIHE